MHLVRATCIYLVISLSAVNSQNIVFERGNGRNRQTPTTPNLGNSNRKASTRGTAGNGSEEIDSLHNISINLRPPNAGQHDGKNITDSLPQNDDSNESFSTETTTKESKDDTRTSDVAPPSFSNGVTELPTNFDTDLPLVNVPQIEFTTRPSIRPIDILNFAKGFMDHFAATATTSSAVMVEESWTSDGTADQTTYFDSIDESSKSTAPSTDQTTNYDSTYESSKSTAPSTDQTTNYDSTYESEISTIQSTDQTTNYDFIYGSMESSTTSTDQTDDLSSMSSKMTIVHPSSSTALPISTSTQGVSSSSVATANGLPSTSSISVTSSETSASIPILERGNAHPNSAETVEEALELIPVPDRGLLLTVDQIPDSDSHILPVSEAWGTISADFCPAADSVTSGQCPCMTANGKTSCVAYNPTYQAVSLEEAVLNFKDTTDPNPLTAGTLAPDPSALGKNGFTSLCPKGNTFCKQCVRKIYEQLADQVSSFSDSTLRNETMGELRSMLGDSRANAAGLSDNCPSINIQTTARRFRIRNDPLQVENCLRSAGANNPIQTGRATGLDNSHNLWSGFPSSNADAGGNRRGQRSKREAREIEGQLTARCETRGQPVKRGEPWVGLCNVCWKWGVLRSDLYPRYINIMTCDSDIKCLSGYGECRQRYRNYQVLRKTGSQYVKYSVNAPFACECQVRSGSALHAFVSK